MLVSVTPSPALAPAFAPSGSARLAKRGCLAPGSNFVGSIMSPGRPTPPTGFRGLPSAMKGERSADLGEGQLSREYRAYRALAAQAPALLSCSAHASCVIAIMYSCMAIRVVAPTCHKRFSLASGFASGAIGTTLSQRSLQVLIGTSVPIYRSRSRAMGAVTTAV